MQPNPTKPIMDRRMFARWAGGIAGILILAFGSMFLRSTDKTIGVDFVHFWMVPQLATEMPEQSVYISANHKEHFAFINQTAEASDSTHFRNLVEKHGALYNGGLHPTASPFLYAVFGMTQIGKFELDFWIYQSVSNVLLLTGVFALGSIIGHGMWFRFLLSVLALLFCISASIDFGVAKTNRLQVGFVSIACWLIARRRTDIDAEVPFELSVLAGAILMGLVTVFKVNVILAPALMGTAMLVDRQWRLATISLAGLVIGIALGVLLGAFYFGDWSCWFQWRSYMDQMFKAKFSMESGNYTFLALIDNPAQLLNISLFLTGAVSLLMAGTIWTSRLNYPKAAAQGLWKLPNPLGYRYTLVGSAGLLIPLVTAPVAWTHYFLMGLPAIILLLAMAGKSKSRIDWALWPLWAIGSGLTSGYFINAFQIRDPVLITATLASGVLMILATVVIVLQLHCRSGKATYG